MICLCKNVVAQLQLVLPQLGLPLPGMPPLPAGSMIKLPTLAQEIQALAAWLASMGQPAPLWQTDPAWIELQLPKLALSAQAMATISAFAQLRAQVLAQLDIDIAIPGQASGFVSLVATLQARLNAMISANASLGLAINPLMPIGSNFMSWSMLAALVNAIETIMAALAQGLLPLPTVNLPPLGPYRPFLVQIHALLPLIAASAQLGLDLSGNITAQLAPMVRAMLQIKLPAFAPPALTLMANLTATLSAVARLSASLKIDVLAAGIVTVRQLVGEMLAALVKALQAALGLTPGALLAQALQIPKIQLPFTPGLMITGPVVQAALRINAQAMAALNWSVPPVSAVAVLSVGLPAIAATEQLKAALGITASLSPCASGCEAAKLLAAV